MFILAFLFLRFVSSRRGERAIIPPESLLCTERTGRPRGDGLAGHHTGLQDGGGVSGVELETTACLGTFPSISVDNTDGGGDHVMTDGNVLLQQHELVMKQLISGRGATNPSFSSHPTALL